ncbi:MAG: hypothetical protein GF401_02540 [Chitinivibrionales bacterium]|nr:hypothetical protein [Chitinivibrionales bacterium]
MNRKLAADLRSKGIAHLYVGVAKSDGVISPNERVRVSYYAKKSQEIMDVFNMNSRVKNLLKGALSEILGDVRLRGWSAHDHLDEAVRLLVKAKKAGDWSTALSGARNEQGLESLALLDGYVFKESRFLKEIKERLKELK